MEKFTVYEIDYHDRCWVVGTASTIQEARKMARKALKRSSGEYPTFIMRDGKWLVEFYPPDESRTATGRNRQKAVVG